MPKRACILALAIGLVVLVTATSATAKGSPTPRGYAVVEGPGLSHPIVISAPWSAAKLGYFGDGAEIFINFATHAKPCNGHSGTAAARRRPYGFACQIHVSQSTSFWFAPLWLHSFASHTRP